MLSQPKSAPAGRQIISTTLAAPQRDYDLNSAFENAERLLDYRQSVSVSLYWNTNIISKLVLAFSYPKKNFN